MLLVDAANVVGSRPDGWWRDRAGAALRLYDAIRDAVADGRLPTPVVIVLEGQAKSGPPEGEDGGIRLVHAPGAGDDCLVEQARMHAAGGVTLVSADRALAERLRDLGAHVVGPRWLLARLEGSDEFTGRATLSWYDRTTGE